MPTMVRAIVVLNLGEVKLVEGGISPRKLEIDGLKGDEGL
jgi:hypothetical protein